MMPLPRRVACDSEEENCEVEGQEARSPRRVGSAPVWVEEEEGQWGSVLKNGPERVRKGWDWEENRKDSADEEEEEEEDDDEDEEEINLRIRRPLNGITPWLYRRHDRFRNPGEPINYGKTTSKFNPAKKKLHMFVRSAERALDQWNETHDEGDGLELVQVVSGYVGNVPCGHFNFEAKPKGSQDDKDVRLFFAVVEAASLQMPPNVKAWITKCSELKQGSMINCCFKCRPKHGVYHPCEFVQLNYDELSEHHRRRSGLYCPGDPNEYYEKCPVKVA